MDRTTAHRPPAPGLERLETRATPAGNVAAFASGGSVFLFGDAADNQVVLQQTQSGEVIVSGTNGTTINGAQSVSLGTGFPESVRIDLGDGSDSVQVFNQIAGSIVVIGGNGDDSVFLGNSGAFGNVEVFGGAGNDTVVLSAVRANNIIGLDGGVGIDALRVVNSFGVRGSFAFNFERAF
jgi:hypothetical protein